MVCRKLLALALCLLVLTPQRLCTCVAAARPCVGSAGAPVRGAGQLARPPAACGHHHHRSLPSDGGAPLGSSGEVRRAGLPAPAHHDDRGHLPGCASLDQRAVWNVGTAAHVDFDAGSGPVTAYGAHFAPPHDSVAALPVLGPPHVPLFLSLRVLRN